MRNPINTDWIVEVAKKCKNACLKCGATKCLEIHHITPLSKGGIDAPENTILLCDLCHKFVHSNKKEKEFYDETKYYKNFGFGEDKREYYVGDINWDMTTDSTDHFEFKCPTCRGEAVCYQLFVRDYGTLNTPACFYLKLKCPRCKIAGQRKMYLNSFSETDELKKRYGEDDGTTTNT